MKSCPYDRDLRRERGNCSGRNPRIPRVLAKRAPTQGEPLAGDSDAVLPVSFPAELAEQAEQLAKIESSTMSELFREAFRTYRVAAVRKRLAAGTAHVQGRAAHRYTEADIERLVDETRAELRERNRKRP